MKDTPEKKDLNKIKTLIETATKAKDSINDILKQASLALSKIDKSDKSYSKLNTELSEIHKITRDAIQIFNEDKKKIELQLQRIINFYDKKYSPLQIKILDPKTGFESKIKEVDKEYKAFLKIKTEYASKNSQLISLCKDFKGKADEITRIETLVARLYKMIQNNSDQIQTIYSNLKKTRQEIEEIRVGVLMLHNDVKNKHESITNYAKESDEKNQEIKNLCIEAESKLKEIQKVYEISHETGLSGEFEKRRNNLSEEIKRWERHLRWSSILLFVGIILFFVFQLYCNKWQLNERFDLNFYIRFLILSPVVYYLYFVSVQYSKAKKLREKYAFKTTLSMTIKSHIELLTQYNYFHSDEQLNKILDFILEGFDKIYNEPYEADDYRMKIKVANFEIEMQKKLIEKLSSLKTSVASTRE